MVTLQKAKLSDIEGIASLQKEFVEHHTQFDPALYKPKKSFSKIWKNYAKGCIKNKSKLFIVCKDRDMICGYMIATIEKRPRIYKIEKIGVLNVITIHKDYRRKGVSQKLMKKFNSWLKEKNVSYSELYVDLKNKAAVKAWKKAGYTVYQYRMIKKVR